MRIGDTIYHLDGLPFRTLDLAERMRALLMGETGLPYRLESYPGGGYVLRRADAAATMPGAETARSFRTPPLTETGSVAKTPVPVPAPPPAQSASDKTLKPRVHRPAVLRANLFRLPWLLAGLLLVSLSKPAVFALLGFWSIASAQFGSWPVRIADGLAVAGGFLMLGILATFWTEWLSAAYTVSATGVEARTGLFAHDTVALRYQDIRSVTLKQSVFERLVGIGTLEFASAGTDGRPVRFLDIARPGRVKRDIEARLARASED